MKTTGRQMAEDAEAGKAVNVYGSIRKPVQGIRSFRLSGAKQSKKNPQDSISNSNDQFDIVKKPKFWSWKRLKAFKRIRSYRFECCFSLQVHSIEGLPAFFDDTCLVVHWKSSDGELMMTRPFRAWNGVALFEDQLALPCPIYVNRGAYNSAKYERKHVVLYVSVPEALELDLGKHHIDLTRLLPVSMDGLEGEKISGEWPTSFRLNGKARGATMHITFGYVIIRNNHTSPPCNDISQVQTCHQNFANTGIFHDQPVENIKDLHEIVPESWSNLEQCEPEITGFDSSVTNELDNDIFPSSAVHEQQNLSRSPAVSWGKNGSHLENIGLNSQEDDLHVVHDFQDDDEDGESQISCETANSISSEFLRMLEMDNNSPCLVVENEPESPRERLLRQFEEDELFNSGFLNFNDSPEQPFTKPQNDTETLMELQDLAESLVPVEKTEDQQHLCNLFDPASPSPSTEQRKPNAHKEEKAESVKPMQEHSAEIFKENSRAEDQLIPTSKTTELDSMGLKMKLGTTKLCLSTTRPSSGPRWLLANGMGKKNKKKKTAIFSAYQKFVS